jgi:hypothetical protein
VAYSLRGDPSRRRVEATAPLKVSRAALQHVLTQPESWARMLPEASDVEVVDTTDGLQRLRLRFKGWDQPVTIEAKPYGNLVNETLPWATLQWRSEEKAPRPVLFTGSWKLRPRTDGTWVTFGFVIEPRQWPEGMAERILSPERVAASILALEKQATQAR